MSKRATREALGDEVLSLGGECDKIYVIDCDVSKSCKTQSFAAAFPDRHVNAGISEQSVWRLDWQLRGRFLWWLPMLCSEA